MTSIAVMVGGALVNALAFSGTNYAFGQLGKEETKRHNLATEQLSKAKVEYSKARAQRLDYVSKTIRERKHAEQTFSDLGIAMEKYYEVTGHQLPPLRDPPKLSDFYNPSRPQKDAELAFVIGGMAIAGLIAYKLS